MDTVRDSTVVLACALGVGLAVLFGAWIWAKVRPLPPTTPVLPPRRDRTDTDVLLTYPPWRKRTAGGLSAADYERPLDIVNGPVDVPDDGLLLPPRQVAGRNGEA